MMMLEYDGCGRSVMVLLCSIMVLRISHNKLCSFTGVTPLSLVDRAMPNK